MSILMTGQADIIVNKFWKLYELLGSNVRMIQCANMSKLNLSYLEEMNVSVLHFVAHNNQIITDCSAETALKKLQELRLTNLKLIILQNVDSSYENFYKMADTIILREFFIGQQSPEYDRFLVQFYDNLILDARDNETSFRRAYVNSDVEDKVFFTKYRESNQNVTTQTNSTNRTNLTNDGTFVTNIQGGSIGQIVNMPMVGQVNIGNHNNNTAFVPDKHYQFNILSQLDTGRFNSIILITGCPNSSIPHVSAPAGERASALVNWATGPGGCGLQVLWTVISNKL